MDEIGWLVVRREYDHAALRERARIIQAAPRVRISSQFTDNLDADDLKPYFHLDGDVLTIRDDYGQRFIYRIRWDDYADGGYLAEWPD